MHGQVVEQKNKQIPRGNDRKKGKGKGNANGFDAKGAKVAKFRHVRRATNKQIPRGNDRRNGKCGSGSGLLLGAEGV
jgi:hypothetical protein